MQRSVTQAPEYGASFSLLILLAPGRPRQRYVRSIEDCIIKPILCHPIALGLTTIEKSKPTQLKLRNLRSKTRLCNTFSVKWSGCSSNWSFKGHISSLRLPFIADLHEDSSHQPQATKPQATKPQATKPQATSLIRVRKMPTTLARRRTSWLILSNPLVARSLRQ